jgi:hypothetical protein
MLIGQLSCDLLLHCDITVLYSNWIVTQDHLYITGYYIWFWPRCSNLSLPQIFSLGSVFWNENFVFIFSRQFLVSQKFSRKRKFYIRNTDPDQGDTSMCTQIRNTEGRYLKIISNYFFYEGRLREHNICKNENSRINKNFRKSFREN